MIDRAQQALHLQGLEPVAETQADPHSYGFRRGRGTQDAIARVFTLLAQRTSAPWILEGDILGCFDNFRHGWLDRPPRAPCRQTVAVEHAKQTVLLGDGEGQTAAAAAP